MSWLSPGRWLLCGALIAALALGVWRLDQSRQAIGYDKAKAEYTAAALKAEQAARSKEQALQSQLTKAQDDAKIRETKLAADAGRARSSADGLRRDLAASRAQLSQASRAALAEYADAQSVVLSDCGTALVDMARQAAGHSNDSLMLLEGWPK